MLRKARENAGLGVKLMILTWRFYTFEVSTSLIQIRIGDVKLKPITPGLIAEFAGANEIPQKEATEEEGHYSEDRERCAQRKG